MSNNDQPIPRPEPTEQSRRTAHLTPRQTWSISTSALRPNIAHMRPQARDTIMEAFRWCIANDITRKDFAAQVEISDNAIWRIINGKYTNPDTGERLDLSTKMEEAIKRWLEDRRAETRLQSDFLHTPTAERVWRACKLALESRTPVFLFGPSHVGKTMALEQFARTHNHGKTSYTRFSAACGFAGVVRDCATGIGQSPYAQTAKLREGILKALRPDELMIFDEVHELLLTTQQKTFFASIEWMREIYDRVGCGMVLCLTRVKWDEVSKHRESGLQQMFRRGVHRIAVGTRSGMVPREDMAMVLEHHGLEWPQASDRITVKFGKQSIVEQPRDILHQISKRDGLKALTERIRYARKFTDRDGRETITWEDFCRAHIRIAQNAQEMPDWT